MRRRADGGKKRSGERGYAVVGSSRSVVAAQWPVCTRSTRHPALRSELARAIRERGRLCPPDEAVSAPPSPCAVSGSQTARQSSGTRSCTVTASQHNPASAARPRRPRRRLISLVSTHPGSHGTRHAQAGVGLGSLGRQHCTCIAAARSGLSRSSEEPVVLTAIKRAVQSPSSSLAPTSRPLVYQCDVFDCVEELRPTSPRHCGPFRPHPRQGGLHLPSRHHVVRTSRRPAGRCASRAGSRAAGRAPRARRSRDGHRPAQEGRLAVLARAAGLAAPVRLQAQLVVRLLGLHELCRRRVDERGPHEACDPRRIGDEVDIRRRHQGPRLARLVFVVH